MLSATPALSMTDHIDKKSDVVIIGGVACGPKTAATLARRAGVKQLFLTHISRRYSERQVRAEAEPIFPNTVVARDFDQVRIVKKK